MGKLIVFYNTRKEKRRDMKKYHWLGLAVVVFVAYLAGVAFPSFGKPIVSKIPGLGAA